VERYSVVDVNDAVAVAEEFARQLNQFQKLLGKEPTHIDSHQHVHRQEPLRSIAAKAAKDLGVPLRDVTPGIRYCGDFYGQDAEQQPLPDALTVENLTVILASLPGTTELGCHPGYGEGLDTVYRKERAVEVQVLCTPGLREQLRQMNISLCSFADPDVIALAR
jgi:predicted glycoside hydrolase/deacetylase ChbG (UPF0249 family)